METAARDAIELRSGVKVPVNKMAAVNKSQKTIDKGELCYRCGKGWHNASQCRFKTCWKCIKVEFVVHSEFVVQRQLKVLKKKQWLTPLMN